MCAQSPEEDSYYYEYPYYDELGSKPSSETEEAKEEKVRVKVAVHLF